MNTNKSNATRPASVTAGNAATALSALSSIQAELADAELVSKGRTMDRFIADYETAHAMYEPLWDKREALLATPKRDDETSHDFLVRIDEEVGLPALEKKQQHPTDIMNRAHSVSMAVLNAKATTIAGLAVKARLAKFTAKYLWEEADADADWDHLILRNLVDAVLMLAGQTSEPDAEPAMTHSSTSDPVIDIHRELEDAMASYDGLCRLRSQKSDVEFENAHGELTKIVHRVELTKATDLESLRLKARALLWCNEELDFMEGETTDVKLARGIIRDLMDLRPI